MELRRLNKTLLLFFCLLFCNLWYLASQLHQVVQSEDALDANRDEDAKAPKTAADNSVHGVSSLEDIMKIKLSALPTPPWPQLDNRVARAIAEGTVIGPPAEVGRNTIVSAYYEFESKHGVGQYETWFKRFLQASDPLIIFLEPGSRWVSFVTERRKHAPTILALLPFDQLVMSTTFAESFWQEQHAIDLEAKIHKGSGVYKIWNEKLVLIHAAIQLNPFNSPAFTWMDAGYFRQSTPAAGEPIVKLNITSAGVPPSKVLLLHVRNDELERTGKDRVAIAGNSFAGTPEAFSSFYDKYYTTMWDWITKGIFVGSDQFVMTETCYRYPDVCHPIFPGRFKRWFYMAEVLGKKECNLSKVSDKFFFGSPPDTVSPPFPRGVVTTMKDLK